MITRVTHRRSFRCTIALLCTTLFGTACAQNAPATALADLLQQQVIHKRVFLSDFNAEPKIHIRVSSDAVVLDTPSTQSFSLVEFDSLDLRHDRITLHGTKHFLLREGPHELVRSPLAEPVTLAIDIDPAVDPQGVSSFLPRLFYMTASEALHALPVSVTDWVPMREEQLRRDSAAVASKPPSGPGCDCSEAHPGCPKGGAPIGSTGPVLVKSVDPATPGDLSTGETFLTSSLIEIGTDGHPSEIWILHASSAGAAGAAAEAVRQYRFKPATCHTKAVAAILLIDTRFGKQ